VCEFIDVPFYEGRFCDFTKRYNVYVESRNKFLGWLLRIKALRPSVYIPTSLLTLLRRFHSRESCKPPMDPEARRYLSSIYHPDLLKLQHLLKRGLSAWLLKLDGQSDPSLKYPVVHDA
jgi:hypothetical protein